jgi:hypothetical protein
MRGGARRFAREYVTASENPLVAAYLLTAPARKIAGRRSDVLFVTPALAV